jgi:hypothetical protein
MPLPVQEEVAGILSVEELLILLAVITTTVFGDNV